MENKTNLSATQIASLLLPLNNQPPLTTKTNFTLYRYRESRDMVSAKSALQKVFVHFLRLVFFAGFQQTYGRLYNY